MADGATGTEPSGLNEAMRVSSIVSDLHDDPAAARVNGLRDDPPAGNLLCRRRFPERLGSRERQD